MQTKRAIEELLQRIDFKFFDHSFRFKVMSKGDGFLIQVETIMKDVLTGEASLQKGGKHYVSKHAIDSEVIFKGFKACKDFATHELHKAFRVDGVQVFDPHVDFESLLEALRYMKRDSRQGS